VRAVSGNSSRHYLTQIKVKVKLSQYTSAQTPRGPTGWDSQNFLDIRHTKMACL